MFSTFLKRDNHRPIFLTSSERGGCPVSLQLTDRRNDHPSLFLFSFSGETTRGQLASLVVSGQGGKGTIFTAAVHKTEKTFLRSQKEEKKHHFASEGLA